jgi:hypothetical protein
MRKRVLASLCAPALFAAGCFLFPAAIIGAVPEDSPEIVKLLADAKAEAHELKADTEDLDSFVKSKLSWQSHATKIEMIKEHVNATGKLLAKMKDAEALGSPWQKEAIARIEPLLKELAGNTEATIRYLNENQTRVHFPEFRDYTKANYELATDLEALIRDFVNYGDTKARFERLKNKLEVTG